MKNPFKANELLNTFSDIEKKEFIQFLNSPFLNSHSRLLPLYTLTLDNKNCTKDEIFEAVYPNEQYNDEKVRKLFSDMNKAVKKFLSLKSLTKDEILMKRYLLKELAARRADKQFKMEIDNAIAEANSLAASNHELLFEIYYLENLKINFNLERNMQSYIAPDVIKRGDAISLFFLYNTFKTMTDNEANKNSFNFKSEEFLTEKLYKTINTAEVLKFLAENKSVNSSFLEIQYKLFEAWQNPEKEELYFAGKKLLDDKMKELSYAQLESLIMTMMNYCMRKNFTPAKNNFTNEKLWLYKAYLDNKVYSHSGYLSNTMYLNILKNIFNLNDLEMAEDFIEKYTKELLPDDIENMRNFSLGLLWFYKKDFEKTLHFASRIKQLQTSDKIGLYTIIICSHYELGNISNAVDEIRNFRLFLKNNKNLAEFFTLPAESFCKQLLNIISFKTKSGRWKNVNRDVLEMTIKNDKYAALKPWLIEKINE